uniref:Uncharacterized protein n=1 Tax=Mustela putorius furo TaxID=9669 RepID=M3YJA3_MUSPF
MPWRERAQPMQLQRKNKGRLPMEPNPGPELITLRSRPELRSRFRHFPDGATQAPHLPIHFGLTFPQSNSSPSFGQEAPAKVC